MNKQNLQHKYMQKHMAMMSYSVLEFRPRNLSKLVALLAVMCGTLAANTVSLGSIGVFAGLGSVSTSQQILVYNLTGTAGGADCTAASTFALSCDSVNFTNWSVEVDYKTLGSQQITQAFNSSATCGVSGCDVIGPGNDPTLVPLFALPYSAANPCCDTLVTQIIFTASLPNQINIWNPGASAQSVFFPQTPFTFTFTIPPGDDYLLGAAPGALTDLLVTDAVATQPGVPEPSTWFLLAASALCFSVRRLMVRRPAPARSKVL